MFTSSTTFRPLFMQTVEMQWVPFKQIKIQAVIPDVDEQLTARGLACARFGDRLRCTRNSVAALVLGPVAHIESATEVQLLPPAWTWLCCLLCGGYTFLNLFETSMVTVVVRLLSAALLAWLITMSGFWLDRGRTERLLREVLDEP